MCADVYAPQGPKLGAFASLCILSPLDPTDHKQPVKSATLPMKPTVHRVNRHGLVRIQGTTTGEIATVGCPGPSSTPLG